MNEDTLSGRDFERLRQLVYAEVGIHLSSEKKTMLEARLRRRLRELNIDSCSDYCDYLFDREGRSRELVSFIDVVTTNKTDFFREPRHFDFLIQTALAELSEGRPLLFWSAGCSSGEEPYTLAILLSEYAEVHPGFAFRILATDVSTAVLAKAELGIYPGAAVEPVSPALRRKYLMRSRDHASDRVRIVPELRRLIEFRRLNFMDSDYGVTEKASAIFCRNVLIYFDRATQERILLRLCGCLFPGGYLFVGHSESLHDLRLPLVPIAPAIYRKTDG